MREYETIYLLKPDLPQEPVKALINRVSEIIKKSGGHVLHHIDWGKRKLAYRVEKLKYGQYIYLQFLDEGAATAEIERILKYDDKVLRFLTVKLQDQVNVEERLKQPSEAPQAPQENFDDMEEPSHVRSGGARSHSSSMLGQASDAMEGIEEFE